MNRAFCFKIQRIFKDSSLCELPFSTIDPPCISYYKPLCATEVFIAFTMALWLSLDWHTICLLSSYQRNILGAPF